MLHEDYGMVVIGAGPNDALDGKGLAGAKS
jgi:hypothetical protein